MPARPCGDTVGGRAGSLSDDRQESLECADGTAVGPRTLVRIDLDIRFIRVGSDHGRSSKQ